MMADPAFFMDRSLRGKNGESNEELRSKYEDDLSESFTTWRMKLTDAALEGK